MLRTGIVVLTGVIAACYSPQLVDRFWVSWLPVCLFISYINPKLRVIALWLASFFWASAVMHWQLDHRLTAQQNNKRLTVVGEVINIPKVSHHSTQFLFKPISISGYTRILPEKLKLSWREAPEILQSGQVWSLQLRLKQPHGYQNPGGFDYERWMFASGIHATGYVLKSAQNSLLDSNALSLNLHRQKINRHIQETCKSCNHSGLMQALAIGYRGNLTEETRRLLKQTGTAHLVAVSGLHIGIISAVFYSIGLLLWRWLFFGGRVNRKEFALILAWMAGLCYSLLSGFDLPAQRAMIMLTLILLSLLMRLPFNLLHSIMAAVMLVLIVSPLAVLAESFWLTFNALMIIAFGSFLLQRESSRIRQMVIIQLLFSILFIPISIFIFGQIHTASMAANLVAVPLVSFIIVPLNFILLMLFWLPKNWLEVLYGLLDKLLSVLIDYLDMLQQNGLQAINVPEIAPWKLMLLIIFAVLLLLPRGLVSRAILLMALPPLVFWHQRQLADSEVDIAVLDVGMGTSIVIQTAQHSLIYDFGAGNQQGYSLGEWVVQPYLRYNGIQQPDRIVISHADQDHAGGYYALQDRFSEVPVYTGTRAELNRKFPHMHYLLDCHQTGSWIWDGVVFEFLTTQPDQSESENNRSCVLKISAGQKSILIAGDIQEKQEQRLIQRNPQKLKADILVAAHHGSLTSSSDAFIDSVNAGSVIFTTGFLNRWKFPDPEVVNRFLTAGSETSQTDKEGAILINCSNDHCRVRRYRRQHPRIWY